MADVARRRLSFAAEKKVMGFKDALAAGSTFT